MTSISFRSRDLLVKKQTGLYFTKDGYISRTVVGINFKLGSMVDISKGYHFEKQSRNHRVFYRPESPETAYLISHLLNTRWSRDYFSKSQPLLISTILPSLKLIPTAVLEIQPSIVKYGPVCILPTSHVTGMKLTSFDFFCHGLSLYQV